jgi:hypothetical protein
MSSASWALAGTAAAVTWIFSSFRMLVGWRGLYTVSFGDPLINYWFDSNIRQ